MINNNTLKYWFREQLDTSTGFDMTNDVAYQNRNFDSSNKQMYFRERFVVTDESPAGNEASVKDGIIFYDVIVDRAAGTDTLDNSAAAIAAVFTPSNRKHVLVESGLHICIDVATTGEAVEFEESRYIEPVRIEFRSYETAN